MADFLPAFDTMIRNEGGYKNHKVPGDRGGQTFAGIARHFHPNWSGWSFIDNNDLQNEALTQSVFDFYKSEFWDRIKGDEMSKQRVATSIFDFAVNAGIGTASKLAQIVIDTTPDGIIGQQSIGKLNQVDEELFVVQYALAKVARYANIVTRDPSQRKFLLGWINRTIGGVA